MTTQSVDREEIARYRSRLRRQPRSTVDLREAVEYFLSVGLLHEAAEPLKELVHREPADVSLRLLYGAVAVQVGQIDEAERAFHDVINRDPVSTAGYHNLALLYLATRRPEQAEQQFKALLQLEPDNGETLNDLGVLYASTGREEEACRMFDRCLTVAPDYRKGRQNTLEFAFTTERHAWGAEWVARLMIGDPADNDLPSWQGKFTEKLRQTHQLQTTDDDRLQTLAAPRPPVHTANDLGTVSVIIPVHNAESLIAVTVESALNQTYSDVEIVVVDDGSTDETDRVLQQFRDRVSSVRRAHRGWAAVANEGIQRSHGCWVLPVGPGYALHPNALTHCVRRSTTGSAVDALLIDETVDSRENPPASSVHDDQSNEKDVRPVPAAWFFHRRAFAQAGFFEETCDDDNGYWSRRLMAMKVSSLCRIGVLDRSSVFITEAQDTTAVAAVRPDAYRACVLRRWADETSNIKKHAAQSPTVKTTPKTGLSLVIIGADDPGEMFSTLAAAINEHTSHHCHVVVRNTKRAHDPPVLLRQPGNLQEADMFTRDAQALVRQADWLVFVAGIAPGAARHDRRLGDADELAWETIDWSEYAGAKRCAAFVCSSPSVRGNYSWYYERFARRGWPIFTASPDIYLHVPGSHFVLPVRDLSCPEYSRLDYTVGPIAVVHQARPEYAAGGEEMLGPVAARLKAKYADRVLFGRCADMSLRETLRFRRRAHIGFDRVSLGAPRFGLTSVENSALGLVNLVYLDAFARALIARTLGTDDMPWVSVDSPETLYEALDRLIGDPKHLQQQMMTTAEWVRRWWTAKQLVGCLTTVLENT